MKITVKQHEVQRSITAGIWRLSMRDYRENYLLHMFVNRNNNRVG